MKAVATSLGREDARRVMRMLTIQKIHAELRDSDRMLRSNGVALDVLVADEDFARSSEVVSLIFAEGDAEHLMCEVSTAEKAREAHSDVCCPRCGKDSVVYPDDPSTRSLVFLVFISLPFLGIPALVWFAYKRWHGSKKKCTSCLHVWRSKP
jgi:hypothetical protein